MSTTVASSNDSGKARPVGDFLLTGVMVMLVVNGFQRVVGLLRGLGFCRFLSEEQLGGWALANSFFVIAVPIALLGLPGSFGKFSEYYRQRKQLGDYVTQVLLVASVGVLVSLSMLVIASEHFNWLVLGGNASKATVLWCMAAFLCLILYSLV